MLRQSKSLFGISGAWMTIRKLNTLCKMTENHILQKQSKTSFGGIQHRRTLIEWTKKINLYWLFGPPPIPGTPEYAKGKKRDRFTTALSLILMLTFCFAGGPEWFEQVPGKLKLEYDEEQKQKQYKESELLAEKRAKPLVQD